MIETVRKSVSTREGFENTDWEYLESDTDLWFDALNVVAADLREERARTVIDRENELERIQSLDRSPANGKHFQSTRVRYNSAEAQIQAAQTRMMFHTKRAKGVAPGTRNLSMRAMLLSALEGCDMVDLEAMYIDHIDRFDEEDWADLAEDDNE